MKYLFVALFLIGLVPNTTWAGYCTNIELSNGCQQVFVRWRCTHDCFPVYRCECPKPKSLEIKADEETQNEIEHFLEQKFESRCCEDGGKRCCGPRCMCD